MQGEGYGEEKRGEGNTRKKLAQIIRCRDNNHIKYSPTIVDQCRNNNHIKYSLTIVDQCRDNNHIKYSLTIKFKA